MPIYRTPTGWMHIKMTNTKKRPAPASCRARVLTYLGSGLEGPCCAMASIACDWPVGDGTCDMPLCAEHAHEAGPDLHYCPTHLAEHRAAADPELF